MSDWRNSLRFFLGGNVSGKKLKADPSRRGGLGMTDGRWGSMDQYTFVRLHAREGKEIYVAAEERGARCIVPLRVMVESRRFRGAIP